VVTGAASGIGAACADELLREQWNVVAWDLTVGRDPRITWRKVNVADSENVRDAASEVTDVQLLINCAGISDRAPAATMHPQQWRRVIDVDLTGTFFCCQALHSQLSRNGGVIVNLASMAGHRAFGGRANYCAAKAGVVALTEVLALEWASDGIRVIAVSPGYVMSPMMRHGIEAGEIDEAALMARIPQKRYATPSEMAAAIVALAGSPFAYMTGASAIIDGGWCANGGF
jgi:NAD(P)-dependent dehydrogenase (short-subunit alcohol dehydrogenase family)